MTKKENKPLITKCLLAYFQQEFVLIKKDRRISFETFIFDNLVFPRNFFFIIIYVVILRLTNKHKLLVLFSTKINFFL